MNRPLAFCLCMLGMLGCAHKAPDEFPISYWCGPPEKFVTQECYNEIRAANFTIAFPACGGATAELNHRLLKYCKRAHLKAFIIAPGMPQAMSTPESRAQADKIIAEYRNESALAGYFLADEPGPTAFASLAQVAEYFRQKDPAHPVFINLLPNYAPEWAIGPSYGDYLDQYLTIVKPFALSYDHYHFTSTGDGPLFFANLGAARTASIKYHTPFWNIVLCTQHGPYRNLTEPELRFEAMQTLAYGGKGLLWFTYWTPDDPSLKWSHAMINADGSRDPHFAMIQSINADVKAIGGKLLHAESTSVNLSGNLTIGRFKLAGQAMTLIANCDYKKPAIAETSPSTWQFDPAKQEWRKLTSDVLTIPPGGAVLLR
jgi:hypothetical protein